jgi:hypothetical protein
MKAIVFVCGIYSIAFAIFHILFWKLFKWKKDLDRLNFNNKAIVQILNIRLIYIFIFTAVVCFVYPDELLKSNLGHFFLGGMSLFWAGRTVEQLILFNNNSWVHYLLLFLFILGTLIFGLPLIF